MNKRLLILIGLLILGLQIISCTVSTASPTAPVARTTEMVTPVTESRQQKWNKLEVEAKKESRIGIVSSVGPGVREALDRGFTGKYGISLDFIAGKPEETVPKLLAERRAGLYLVDLLIAGVSPSDSLLESEGALESLDTALMLPEVLDKKLWWGGDLIWVDPNHFHVMFLAMPRAPVTINTDFVKSDEIKSYNGLLDPKWKGKIAYLDPTMSGAGRETFRQLGETLGMEYLRKLGNQEPVITRDERMMIEWVARAKYPIGIGIKPELQIEFKKAGAPIKTLTPIEGTFIGGGGGGLLLINKAAHPNAAKLFTNWLLSREGQIVASQAFGGQSAREDIPIDFLEPEVTRQPGVNYRPAFTLEANKKSVEYGETAKEMWGHLMK